METDPIDIAAEAITSYEEDSGGVINVDVQDLAENVVLALLHHYTLIPRNLA